MSSLSNLEEFFDRVAPERDKWRRRGRVYYEDLESFLQFLIPPNVSVLELGSGTGDLLNRLRPCRGVGVDISGAMVTLAKKKYPHLCFIHSAAEDLPLTEKFEYVVLSNLVGYARDVQRAFEKIQGVCTPETRVVVTYYNFLWEPILKLAEKVSLRMPQPPQNWLSLADLENLIHLTGFEAVKKGERFLCPLRVPLVAAFINKFFCKLPLVRKLCLTSYVVARPSVGANHGPALSCSVIVPARNEKGNIQELVDRMPVMGSLTEVIIVEGHSTDGTREEIERVILNYQGQLRLKLLVQEGEGKGDAVRKGFEEATGDILIILDADLTVPPEDLPKFFQALAANRAEFINGSRLVYQRERQSMRFLNLLGNKFFRLAFTWVLDQRVTDTLCGTKALFKKDYLKIKAARAFFGDFDPFGDFDLLFGAAKLNLKIIEIPVRYQERKYGSTNISRFRHGWLLLRMCMVAARRLKFS